ncbi:DNA phosphorothioation-associated protein 4 [Nodosilinea sp. FACHB-131]|uniref:DNA phosphorothioation-associated protein 4 n=1 Tax=Cyanophyceae TaxID=3028117 RepID=UPI0016821548|nr:DNA phosphorothioation-associated protein 4 [Nodosilinea sp. FACHB-131]MBD1876718.1 DNA phosphorothioation-associated protein 4 [Nodosilinea sp. FACHB-131]
MGDARIKIARDKAELVQSLLASEDTTGPFQTYADIIAFAAVVGFQQQHKLPLSGEISKRDPAPIHRETFASKGYEMLLNLIAVAATNETNILSSDEDSSARKLRIFEEYINGGLEILKNRLLGSVDYAEKILLEISQANNTSKESELNEFDLSSFI